MTLITGTGTANTLTGDRVAAGDADTIIGLAGNDTLSGLGGTDSLLGGTGNDSILGGDGDDTLVGDEDNSALGGEDRLFGGAGNDVMRGNVGNDFLSGGIGNDTLTGGDGSDVMTGGTGADLFTFDPSLVAFSDTVTDFSLTDGDQIDMSALGISDFATVQQLLSVSAGNTTLKFTAAGAANLMVLQGFSGSLGAGQFQLDQIASDDFVEGSTAADDLFGGLGNDVINSNGGTDRLFGEGGSDDLAGGDGTQSLFGGADSDRLRGYAGNDSLYGGDGSDSMSGDSGTSVVGPDGNDLMSGGLGNDNMTGDAGNDTLNGGAGSDFMDGGLGTDVAVFTGNWSDYVITDFGGGNVTIADQRVGTPDGTDSLTGFESYTFSNGTFTAAMILNDAPVAVNNANGSDLVTEAGGTANALPGDASSVGNVLTNDTDPDSPLGDTKTVTGARIGAEGLGGGLSAVAGSASLTGTYGTLVLNANGSYTYTLNNADADTQGLSAGLVRTDAFTYRVADARGMTDTAELVITITGANDAPVISSNGGGATASVTVDENATSVTTVTTLDPDAGATQTYSIAGGADGAFFTINAATGALSFVTGANFEAPLDAGKNNVYDVRVRVSDGTLTDLQDIAVTVTNVNDAPVITSNGGGATAAVSVAENTTAVTTVTSTDHDSGATRSYAIVGGADAGLFTINAATGALAFVTGRNFEVRADNGANNVYDVQIGVTDGSLTDIQSLAVTITNVNEAPAITSNGGGATAAITVAENTTAVTTVTASDADAGAALTYFIVGGADAAQFTINASTGALAFVGARNFEAPGDVGANGVFDVRVRVSDGVLTDEQDIAVTIGNANEAPVITSNGGGATAVVSVAENTTAVTTVASSDPDAGATRAYSIVGGADSGLFTINATTGALAFASGRNFESPSDAGANNVYDVQVRVSDGTLTDVQSIAVTVTNVNDAPVITSNGGGATAAISVAETSTAVTTLTATDQDAGAILRYSIVGGADAAKFTVNAITGALSFVSVRDFETPSDVGGNGIYDVQVKVSDGTLSDVQTIAVTLTNANDAPVITSNGGGTAAAISVAENSTAVTTVTASDQDLGATRTYSIVGGADAGLFTINATTGALAFGTGRNFEARSDVGANNVYDVQVRVSDGTLTDVQSLAVTVTNVNEAPVITTAGGGATGVVFVAENTTAAVTATATDPDSGATRSWSIVGGADAALFTINVTTGALAFVTGRDFELPGDAGANNVYDVRVQVSDGTLTDVQDLSVVITDAAAVTITGTSGADVITAASTAAGQPLPGNEADLISGLGGNDTLAGLGGNDTVYGGDGLDNLNGGVGDDYLDGGIGIDVLDGSTGNDSLYGGADADQLLGGEGTDFLSGGDGNDVLNGGTGADGMTGGAGDDTIYIDNAGDMVNETGGGIDRVYASVSVNLTTLSSGVENLTLQGSGTIHGTGNALGNVMNGNSGNNILSGLNGNDTLDGGVGNDSLIGGNDNDMLLGSNGNDTLDGSAGADTLQGGANEDSLRGGADNDLLIGGTENDRLDGGTGDDTLNGGTGADIFVFADSFGLDQIDGFSTSQAGEVIDISALVEITSFSDLLANHLSEVNANAVITDGANTITLVGVSMASLLADDFLF